MYPKLQHTAGIWSVFPNFSTQLIASRYINYDKFTLGRIITGVVESGISTMGPLRRLLLFASFRCVRRVIWNSSRMCLECVLAYNLGINYIFGYHYTNDTGSSFTDYARNLLTKGSLFQCSRCESNAGGVSLLLGNVGTLVIAYLVLARAETSSFSIHPFSFPFLIPFY